MDHSTNTLTAAIKSLTDAVAPAVDQDDPLAAQQLALVVDFLGFLRDRVPYLHGRAVIGLRRSIGLADQVRSEVEQIDGALAAELGEALQEGRRRLSEATVSDEQLEEAAAWLDAVLREALRAAPAGPPAARVTLERAVLADHAQAAAFERAWYLPLGFDPRPEDVPALEDAMERLV